jgi:hypothetical protein
MVLHGTQKGSTWNPKMRSPMGTTLWETVFLSVYELKVTCLQLTLPRRLWLDWATPLWVQNSSNWILSLWLIEIDWRMRLRVCCLPYVMRVNAPPPPLPPAIQSRLKPLNDCNSIWYIVSAYVSGNNQTCFMWCCVVKLCSIDYPLHCVLCLFPIH